MVSPKITMKDIARQVNVSVATASRVINQPHLVTEETREMVLEAMRETGYVYNALAGNLSRNHSNTIGVIIPTAENQAFASTVRAIQAESTAHNYAVMVYSSNYDHQAEGRILRQFLERRVDGVILTALDQRQLKTARLLINHGIACIFLWEVMDEPDLHYVGFDNFQAGAQAADHLLSLGHGRVGIMAGPFSKVDRVARRVAGCRSVFQKMGVPWRRELVLELEPTLAAGSRGAKELMDRRNPPTAILALSDTLALGALAGLRDLGLTVPQDVSLSGFDDIEYAAYATPALTTLRVPAADIGTQAVRNLLNLMRDPQAEPCRLKLGTELVVRQSTRAHKPGQ